MGECEPNAGALVHGYIVQVYALLSNQDPAEADPAAILLVHTGIQLHLLELLGIDLADTG